MPCSLASNVRFICADQQQGKSKTAPQKNSKASDQQPQSQSRGARSKVPICNVQWAPIKPHMTLVHKWNRSKPARINRKELERLHSAEKVVSIEERLEALARREELAKQLDEQAKRAREHFAKIDERRLEAAVANVDKDQKEEENLFGVEDNRKTLERAFIEKCEQEEEVRAVNRTILNAKCHAIRDAQIQEMRNIKRDQKREEQRLEKMVVDNAANSLAQEDCHADQQRSRNDKYAHEIRQQLVHRLYLQFVEGERAEEEARAERQAAIEIKKEDRRKALEATEKRRKFREDLDRTLEMSNIFKKMLCEQEKEAERRIANYWRERRVCEEEEGRKRKQAKEEFERKQQHMYNLGQKIADSKAHRDELSYVREQERNEREYRRREKELVLHKKQVERDIKAARQRQMKEIKERHALQIAREEKEFYILIDNLKKAEELFQKKEEERAKQRTMYRTEIVRQMSDKAQAKRRMIEEERREANILREAEIQRLANIQTVIDAKLIAMREACLPDAYIRDVERHANRLKNAKDKKTSIPNFSPNFAK